MKVLFVASEVAPWAKTGGLADVASALPRALRKLGHEVHTFLPLYPRVLKHTPNLEVIFREHVVELGRHTYRFGLYRDPASTTYFVGCPELYGRESIYTQDPDEHLRFLLLSRAALESTGRLGFWPEIIHCNDWQTGLIPLYLKTIYAREPRLQRARSLLTIHNLYYQGGFRAEILPDTGLAAHAGLFHQDQLRGGRISFLLHGILYADGLSTVSPTYSREIQTPELGAGLDGFLRARSSRVVGILNGVDYEEWDPATDKHIPAHYSAEDLSKKRENKAALFSKLGLGGDISVPAFGVVSRLVAQKGLDLAAEVLPRFLSRTDLRLAVLGSGESRVEELFKRLVRSFPGRVGFVSGYDPPMAHLIEAGADFFLMPSRYEPCGLNQMYSLKYGTVPIVHQTGGLADTVELWNPATGEGTGIPFKNFDAPAMEWALSYALDIYRDPTSFARLMRNGMAKSFTWERQAGLYVDLYERLLSL